jgi:membrane-bound ClpP family serine protease
MTSMLTLAQAAGSAAPAAPDSSYFVWGCLLFGVAMVLLCIEFFVPSGGLIGILCGVAAIGSIVAFFKYDTGWGVGVALAYVVLTPITLVFVFRLWLNSPVARMMILGGPEPPGDSEETAARFEQDRQRRQAELRQLIGAEGVTETALRPVGTVRINGQRTDGFAETGVIEADTLVVVTDVYDNQIKVRPR